MLHLLLSLETRHTRATLSLILRIHEDVPSFGDSIQSLRRKHAAIEIGR